MNRNWVVVLGVHARAPYIYLGDWSIITKPTPQTVLLLYMSF